MIARGGAAGKTGTAARYWPSHCQHLSTGQIACAGTNHFDLRFTSITHVECADMDTVLNELREVLWLVSVITGLSVASVSLAVALASA